MAAINFVPSLAKNKRNTQNEFETKQQNEYEIERQELDSPLSSLVSSERDGATDNNDGFAQ